MIEGTVNIDYVNLSTISMEHNMTGVFRIIPQCRQTVPVPLN